MPPKKIMYGTAGVLLEWEQHSRENTGMRPIDLDGMVCIN